ncbi:hypothetical protein PF005_g25264 [Phytophthora fragariae]|uniref:RxLR effector protein n=1 Tax=Phytophthora fragariae TaxID=53985 RepID=A0A6A3I247_9STRA|nr:hypothetical protein PF003_g18544 [Phytophthora fragariae]KAE8923697.1 hypothetical protein PF009_g26059 [Phytophthora fragariae]KAE8976131.1 hypothetical protein PF011_g24178 [Phytophthora fragariae]KAE9074085.1 hypothetical protein PF010_g24817 [Phytophthora fragariae]KAE9074512.1 hypothetical protein PF007_g25378 [Phytophthora fragariae]
MTALLLTLLTGLDTPRSSVASIGPAALLPGCRLCWREGRSHPHFVANGSSN